MTNNPDAFTAAFAILAFILAFYALTARERKTPYIITSIYSSIFVVIISVLVNLLVRMLASWFPGQSTIFHRVSLVPLLLAVTYVFLRVWKIYNRQNNLRDDNLIRNLVLVRWLRSQATSLRGTPRYEDNPTVAPGLVQRLREVPYLPKLEGVVLECDGGRLPVVVVSVTSYADCDGRVIDLAERFLEQAALVQYTSCGRHPVELIRKVRRRWKERAEGCEWGEVADRLIAIDGYTPHFGFTDSVYAKMTKELKSMGVVSIRSNPSYAGIHTANARAFNRAKALKPKSTYTPRPPTLVIYEGTHALVDLESTEQYRVFLRHVLPSERLWGGMLTVAIEAGLPESELALLRCYCDVYLDLCANEKEGAADATR